MPFTEDLSAFLADFGETVTLDGVSVAAIFDAEYATADVGFDVSVSGPALTLPTTSVPAAPVGKAAVVQSVTYSVAEHKPDGTGMSVLRLRRV